MKTARSRSLLPLGWMLAALMFGGMLSPLRADDATIEEDQELASPLFVFNIGSVDRALSDVTYMFEMIGRPDMNDLILNFIANNLGDIDGVDRTRPLGYVFFLQTDSLPPRPIPVAFVPIENLKDAIQTMSLAPAVPTKVNGRDDLIEGIGENERIFYVARILGKYAYITENGTREILDSLPDLSDTMDSLANRYDVSMSLRMSAIPEGIRQVFINFLRAQSETELQRRDNENEGEYLARRAAGISALDSIEEIALEGEEITIGFNGKPEERQGVIELNVKAKPGSDYATALRDMSGKTSIFTPLFDENRPVSASASFKLRQRDKDFFLGIADAARAQLKAEIPELSAEGGTIDQLHESAKATIDAGQLDAFFQVASTEPGKFAVIGGLKIVGGNEFGVALGQLLDQVAILALENGENVEIRTRAENYEGVTLHKIAPQANAPIPDDEREMFGDQPAIHIGTSSRVLWVAFGSDNAMTAFRQSVDTLLSATAEQRAQRLGPFQATFRAAPWLELPEPRRDRGKQRRQLAEDSFDETDAIRIEMRPGESSLRVKATISEGFFKLLGSSIAADYDRSQL